MTQYDPVGNECSGGEQPGTRSLMDLLVEMFPGSNDDAGIYNCRNVRSGSTRSFHSEGRALDITAANDEQQRQIADTAVANSELWGVQEVIDYGRKRRWDARRGWEYYGNVHGEKHVHVTTNWESSNRLAQPRIGQAQLRTEEEDMRRVVAYTGEKAEYGGQVWLLRGDNSATPLSAHEDGQYAACGIPGVYRIDKQVLNRHWKRTDGDNW